MDRLQQTVTSTADSDPKGRRIRRRPSRTLQRRRGKELARTAVFYGVALFLAALLSYALVQRQEDRAAHPTQSGAE